MAAVPAKAQQYTIYRLIDPRDNSTRYVGLSSNVLRRYAAHILGNSPSQMNAARSAWLEDLNQQGFMPVLDVIESGIRDRRQAEEREAYWIRVYHDSGANLLNIQGVPRIQPLERPKNLRVVTVNQRLKQHRLEAILSKAALARRAGVDVGTVTRAEESQPVQKAKAEAIAHVISQAIGQHLSIEDLGIIV